MKFNELVMLLENDEGIKIKRKYWDGKAKKKLRSLYYLLNDRPHRTDGPAIQTWHQNSQKFHEAYYLNGELHRKDGPAVQEWYDNGQKATEEYYINGEKVSKEVIDVYTGYSDDVRKDIDDLDIPDF